MTPAEPRGAADDKIVDVTEAIEHRRAVERFARLSRLVQSDFDEIARDPHPFLKRAYERAAACEQRLEEIRRVLAPSVRPYDPNERPKNIASDALSRLNEIYELAHRPIGFTR
jgi:hypothetical protein